MLLKGKLKLPEKALKAFPDLGSMVKGGVDVDGYKEGSESAAFELGEELETFQPNALGSETRESDIEILDEESDAKIRPKTDVKDGSAPIPKHGIDVDEKRSDLEYELSQKEINLEKLQKIASTGIPDGGSLRATTWKLLLGYLPDSRDLWEKVLSENRLKYAKLKEELLLTPSEFSRRKEEAWGSVEHADCETAGPLHRHDISNEDHPLSLGEASAWHKFFECTEIAEQIDRDLQRTHPEMKFFSESSSLGKKNKEAMRNILLLFAKLNPTTRYVQGMNEVLAPIYYVFSVDTDEQNAANSEADSFCCFVRLLSDSVDHFCQKLDNSSVGIHATLSRLKEMLKVNEEELWRHLEFTSKVNPQFYAFRWITLLLTQEFEFKKVLRIWDSLLSSSSGVQDMLRRVCCAMLLCVKSRLLSGDFAGNLSLLQHYPEVNIEHLLQVARDLSPDPDPPSIRISL
ncbi:hypothetical protein Ancab_006877 [Ancistrocladus abbreviatus]